MKLATDLGFFLFMEAMRVLLFKMQGRRHGRPLLCSVSFMQQQQQDGFDTAEVGLAAIINEMSPIRILAVDDSVIRLQLILIFVWKQVGCLFIFGIRRSRVLRPTIPDALRNFAFLSCLIDEEAAAKRHEQAVLSPEVYCSDRNDLGVQEYRLY